MPEEVVQIPVGRVSANPYQPRLRFSEEALEELAESIRRHGVLQPIIVRPDGPRYTLVAGERRLRAAQRAGLGMIPAVVRAFDERQMLEIALVENLQRQDINPVEAARGFQRLAEEFGLTHGEIAQRTGKSRASVVNALRLLQLPSDIQRTLEEGQISEGHARAILTLPEHRDRRALCAHIIRNGLSVREAEQAARGATPTSKGVTRETPLTTPDGSPSASPLQADLEERLRRHFATRVRLEYAEGKGSITVDFYGDEDLARILELLGLSEG